MRINNDGTCFYRGKMCATLRDALLAIFSAMEAKR